VYALNANALAENDACEIAKASWNSAHRWKNAFTTLVFVLGAATLIALVYTYLAFDNDQQARGWLGLISAVVTGAGATFLIKLRSDASKDEETMFNRVNIACQAPPPAPGS
jgi:hypothetical protein